MEGNKRLESQENPNWKAKLASTESNFTEPSQRKRREEAWKSKWRIEREAVGTVEEKGPQKGAQGNWRKKHVPKTKRKVKGYDEPEEKNTQTDEEGGREAQAGRGAGDERCLVGMG